MAGARLIRMGDAGLALLRQWEQGPDGGPALVAYRCPAGKWTLGFGITGGVSEGDTCTPEAAEQTLRRVADLAAGHIADCVTVPLSPNQADALACLTFNIGAKAFEDSTLLRLLNEGRPATVPFQLARWCHVNGTVSKGLSNRRAAEIALWDTP